MYSLSFISEEYRKWGGGLIDMRGLINFLSLKRRDLLEGRGLFERIYGKIRYSGLL